MKSDVFPAFAIVDAKALLAEQECSPLIRSRCYNIQMQINFILMEFGLFCLLIISRLMSCAIFNFSFQIRCPRMYQKLT